MSALVAVETVLLVVLVVLVAGLLRSHAEILRRLGPPQDGEAPLPAPPPAVAAAAQPASGAPGAGAAQTGVLRAAPPAITGQTPRGDSVALSFSRQAPTLLAFLTGGCSTCAGFWETLGEGRLPEGLQKVIVTHGRERESPSRIRALAPSDVPVVMSSSAWADYRVPGAPYFVLVDDLIRGEGVATSWPALASLVTDAVEDERMSDVPSESAGPPARGGAARARTIDLTFAAAGIGQDHPSLYPTGDPRGREEAEE